MNINSDISQLGNIAPINISDIVSQDNYLRAIGVVFQKLSEAGSLNKYKSYDGQTFKNTLISLDGLYLDIKDELLHIEEARPSIFQVINANNKDREIFKVPIIEKIKIQMLTQVLEDHFEKLYSNNLHSYRTHYTVYYALKSVIKRYKKRYQTDYIYKFDINSYFDTINADLVIDVLKKYNIDDLVLDNLRNSILSTIIKEGKLVEKKEGILTGNQLTNLVGNSFLLDFDLIFEKKASLYKRVCDDVLLMHPSYEHLSYVKKEIEELLKERGLKVKPSKTLFARANKPFIYLGYSFNNGEILIPEKSLQKFLNSIINTFPRDNIRLKNKLYKIKKKLLLDKAKSLIEQYISSYPFLSSNKQLFKLNQDIQIHLTKYIHNSYSEKKHNDTKKILKSLNYKSPKYYYKLLNHGIN